MFRNIRTSFACARCYKRKKRCDREYPSCSQCRKASVECIGLDRGSEAELPRSLVTYLEDLVAQLELERQGIANHDGAYASQSEVGHFGQPLPLPPISQKHTTSYELAAAAARNSAPISFLDGPPPLVLPYYKTFFMGAELPYPLAFQIKRPISIPSTDDDSDPTKLPIEVADKLIAVYTERILPQYPVFLKHEVLDMFQRSKNNDITSDEQFMILMIKAITTLSSRSKEYRKLVSLGESLRRDAFTCLDFGLSCNNATITTIQQLILLAQYGTLLPSSTNLWHIVGDATQIALELGLHQETPSQAGLDGPSVEARKRVFWTLYSLERSIAIASHRPYSVSGDQIQVAFPVSQYEQNSPDHSPTQEPYLRFIDRVQFLRLQSEICSVNIGMRPTPNPGMSHEDWMSDVERRIAEIQSQAVTSKWCDFLQWQSKLLLHMPCRRNPEPNERSALEYFDAAVRIASGYWELAQLDQIDSPWHAAHHCYEAGYLILYSLWYLPRLIRQHYTTKKVFEIVHEISSFFILIMKQWPAAQHCGALFDELRKGALGSFRDENSLALEASIEAKQLKELVFRENADLLYARDQALSEDHSLASAFPDFGIQDLALDFSSDLDYLNFFQFPETSNLEIVGLGDDARSEAFPELSALDFAPNTGMPYPPATAVNKTQLSTALQRLPVCTHCKRRRIKCDMSLPACRSCTKLQRECRYWDSALSQEISRKHIYALKIQVEKLMTESNVPTQGRHCSSDISPLETASMAQDVREPWAGHAVPFPGLVVPSILCRTYLKHVTSFEVIFFGPTSLFARLATEVGYALSSPGGAIASPRHQPKLEQTLFNSLVVNSTAELPSMATAEHLTSLYYRSIEICFPILGQSLIRLTLNEIYCAGLDSVSDGASHIRFNLILAISLALLSQESGRLRIASQAYFREAVSRGLSADLFILPTNKSLQLVLLVCVYVWICPSTMDIWRLIGHASRMCLDIIEVHGSDKTDSADAGILYRTLYTLETQLSIAFGRPRHLPDGTEVPASSPDPTLTSGDELSTLVYNLARFQNRFYKDMVTKKHDNVDLTFDSFAVHDLSWMSSYVQDIKAWLADWNVRVESFVQSSQAFHGYGEDGIARSLELLGRFQQSQALAIAKQATDSQSQLIISDEDALASCKQLIEAANGLRSAEDLTSGVGNDYPSIVFPFTWTHTHSIFNSALILLRHIYTSPPIDAETEQVFQMALKIISSGEKSSQGKDALVTYLRSMYDYRHLATPS